MRSGAEGTGGDETENIGRVFQDDRPGAEQSTAVTNAGMKELAGLKSLAALDLVDTRVTKEGISRLRKAHPGIQIIQ